MQETYNTYNGKAYRFLSFEGLHKTIQSSSLRFTRPDQFNDPLDNSSLIAPLKWEEWKEIGLTAFAEKRYTNHIFRSIYISSFCKEYEAENSYLMWAHYGDKNHTGVAFEIDFSKVKYLDNPDNVIYPPNLVEKRNELKNDEEIGYFLVTNKHKVWSYEKEIRLIVDTEKEGIKNDSRIKKSCDEKHLFVDFDLNYISKIIFGINADKENELITINMLKEKGFNPEFRKMRINPVSLSLASIKYTK